MQIIDLICLNCKHYREFTGGCSAFPDGIPEEIGFENKHDKPLEYQKNNFVFEPINEQDAS